MNLNYGESFTLDCSVLDVDACSQCEGQAKTDAMLGCYSEYAVRPGRLRKLSTDFVIMLTCRAKFNMCFSS